MRTNQSMMTPLFDAYRNWAGEYYVIFSFSGWFCTCFSGDLSDKGIPSLRTH